MRQATHSFEIATHGKGLYEITSPLVQWVRKQKLETGLLTLFCRHTSASLLIQENADPDVQTDLHSFFERVVPESRQLYVHSTEGPDDMPAHIRSALTQSSLGIPLVGADLALGTWQGVYLFEHRVHPHRRRVVAHLIGE